MPAVRLIALMCLAEIVGMAGFASFPALLPTFIAEWGLSGKEAGWISGIYFAGYTVAVPVLVALTDRVDGRTVFLGASLLNGAATLGFALGADGFWSALVWRALAGAAFAGCYMPGLKLLTDRIDDRIQPRAVAVYTASFGIGVSLSYFLAGLIAPRLGWPGAFGIAALGSLLAIALVGLLVAPRAPEPSPERGHLLDFRPVLRNRPLMGYVLAYAAHNWELFGFRSWIVAFLVFSAGLQGDGGMAIWSAATIAAIFNLIGWPASVFGNEGAMRFGRRRAAITYMCVSAVLAGLFGFTAALPFLLVLAFAGVYAVTITWDSSTITAGAIGAADPGLRGATMAVHSCIGFAGAAAGPVVFGWVLDLGGGMTSVTGWGLAFASMGLALLFGPLAIFLLGRGACA